MRTPIDERQQERLRIAEWLRTPITGLDDYLTPVELSKYRTLLDMTAKMIERNQLLVGDER